MIKCVCYMELGSNGFFMIGATLTDSHYRANIISSVGHLRSDPIMPLMLCTIAYNIQGTSVVL